MAKYKVSNDNKARIIEALAVNKIAYWELADEMGLHENTVSKRLRKPTDEQTKEFLEAVQKIVNNR